MKSFYLIVLLLFNFLFTYGQGSIDYTLTVRKGGGSFANANVIFTETSTREKIFRKTNSTGKVHIMLDRGAEWSISVEKIKNEWFVEVPPRGNGTGSSTIGYDFERWERENRPPVDRSKLKLQRITQNISSAERPNAKEAILAIICVDQKGKEHRDFPVNVTCYNLRKTFIGHTDNKGVARFKVPIENEYEIDIDGINSFEYADIGKRSGLITRGITYEPTNIKEKHYGDTIVQSLSADQKGTSSRSKFKLKVKGGKSGTYTKEAVYLRMLKSNTVYKAKTNSAGEAEFLLPNHRKYMIDFNFQKDVDVVDLSRVRGIAEGGMELSYRPNPRLEFPEKYLPKPNEVFVEAFEKFIDKQFPEPTDQYLKMYTKWATGEINENSKEAILEIGFASQKRENYSKNGKEIPGPPINICFVIDKSGSMAGYDRIESLTKSMVNLVDQLRANDIVSVVTFDSKSRVVYPSRKVGDGVLLKEVIADIEAGGGTEIYQGLEKGFSEVLKHFNKENTNKVILLTDGFGSRPVGEVVSMAKTYVDQGVEVSAIGVGGGYNQALLSQLATVGGGLMHYVGEAKNIDEAFNKELKSSLYPIAKNALIEVFYNEKCVFRQLYGYPHKRKGSSQFNMEINNIYPGLNKLALIKFDLEHPTKAITKQPIRIKMTYYDFEKEGEIVQEEEEHLKWTDNTGKTDLLIERNHKKLYAIAIMNQAIKVMAEAHAEKNNEKALKVIQSAMSQVKELFPEANDADVKKLMEEMYGYTLAFEQIMKNLDLKKG